MPLVPERPLSYGEIQENLRRVSSHSHQLIPATRKNKTNRKRVKAKLKDKKLFNEAYDQQQHLQSIVREEF